ncbi:MAG TPA: glutathione S-transferase family protein [Alphaproteobacteria bacterium]|nr:glutathione S-transferase family protein [Alphaproteobacteria bacterium]
MQLYSGPLSLFSRKVEIALNEKRLPFERVMVPFSQAAGYSPKHPVVLAANPKAQVPVLVDGDLTLFDSTLILEYLEDAYPEPPLYPGDAKMRARCRLLELEADEILLQPVRLLMYRTEPAHTDHARRQSQEADGRRAEAALKDHYGKLQAILAKKDYFCGAFSVADIALFMTLLFARRLKGPGLDAHEGLANWYVRVSKRPAVAVVAAEIAEADRVFSAPIQLT